VYFAPVNVSSKLQNHVRRPGRNVGCRLPWGGAEVF
jgi:hypothetical protein